MDRPGLVHRRGTRSRGGGDAARHGRDGPIRLAPPGTAIGRLHDDQPRRGRLASPTAHEVIDVQSTGVLAADDVKEHHAVVVADLGLPSTDSMRKASPDRFVTVPERVVEVPSAAQVVTTAVEPERCTISRHPRRTRSCPRPRLDAR